MKTVAICILQVLFLFHEAEMKNHNPSSASALQAAIDSATAGDIITLEPKEYIADLKISNSGMDGSFIQLIGTSINEKHTSIAGNIKLKANFWVIKNLEIKKTDTAIKITGNHNYVDTVITGNLNRAVVINGNDNTVQKSTLISLGAAIVIESGTGNKVIGNAVTTKNPSLHILEKTCCGIIDSNTFSGPVDVKGNRYTLTSNVANGGVNLDGCDTQYSSNVFFDVFITKSCNNNDMGFNVLHGVSTKAQTFDMEKVGAFAGTGAVVGYKWLIFTNFGLFTFSALFSL